MDIEFCLEPTESEVQIGYPGKMSRIQYKNRADPDTRVNDAY